MADYGAWQGLGNALSIGSDAFSRARAARTAVERQAALDAEAKSEKERANAEHTREFDLTYKLKQDALAAQKAANAAKNGGTGADSGKRLPTTGINAQDLANFPTDLKNLKNLAPSIAANADVVGPWAGPANAFAAKVLPEFLQPKSTEKYKQLQADMDNVKQVIGKIKEGGVLRKEDEDKYNRILAQVKDDPKTAQYKIGQIANEMASKYNATIDLLGKQGYKTAGLDKQDAGAAATDDFSQFWGD